jgi:phage portal protein BeeE
VLAGGLKYRPINPSQKEMDFVESRRFNRDEIL